MDGWRVILGDLAGRPIANLSPLARSKSVTPRFARPGSFTARVPSADPSVGGTHTDGLPMLEALCRTIRAFRYEQLPDGSFAFVCRHAGIVWTVQDDGDANGTAWTTFTSYDPMQRLAQRFTGIDTAPRTGDAAQLAKQIVDATNALGYTGISTSATLGAVFNPSTSRSVQYQNQDLGSTLIDLASAYNSFDLDFRPVYQPPGTEDGTLVVMSCLSRKGSYRPGAVFAWGRSPHNVASVSRQVDASGVANVVTGTGGAGVGADTLTSTKTDATSIARFGRYEKVDSSVAGVADQALLDSQVTAELQSSAHPTVVVNVTPATAKSARSRVPRPWQDFDVGDTVPVFADAALRGGVDTAMRVYGFTVNIADETGVETVTNIAVSPEGA